MEDPYIADPIVLGVCALVMFMCIYLAYHYRSKRSVDTKARLLNPFKLGLYAFLMAACVLLLPSSLASLSVPAVITTLAMLMLFRRSFCCLALHRCFTVISLSDIRWRLLWAQFWYLWHSRLLCRFSKRATRYVCHGLGYLSVANCFCHWSATELRQTQRDCIENSDRILRQYN